MPSPRKIVFTDFDGTMTDIAGGDYTVFPQLDTVKPNDTVEGPLTEQQEFYRSLFIKQEGPFAYHLWKLQTKEALQAKFLEKLGPYDPTA
ncbi:hypothetical protein [Legionella waltersii]|uniref:Uncharacterized protein n=1 Tax=Legionella waltersii TaxID=66969 RepID=A0A0W1AB59_9GAMM|nr:hypothetical protein [Legionella waltersii]KTD78578.1 hypothetical protein Lwal_1741 [Legionella waltersii]SNV11525.1 Uncharacterised protein [Legionella waltersii]